MSLHSSLSLAALKANLFYAEALKQHAGTAYVTALKEYHEAVSFLNEAIVAKNRQDCKGQKLLFEPTGIEASEPQKRLPSPPFLLPPIFLSSSPSSPSPHPPLSSSPHPLPNVDYTPVPFGKFMDMSPVQIANIDPSYIVWMYRTVKGHHCSETLYQLCLNTVDDKDDGASYFDGYLKFK